MNKTKTTILLALFLSNLSNINGASDNSEPAKPSKYTWRASLDIAMSEFKSLKGSPEKKALEGEYRWGFGVSFGVFVPIGEPDKASGFWVEPMLGAYYFSKVATKNNTPTGLVSEIRVIPMVDFGYSLLIVSPFIGVQATAHILTDTKPDNYSENMFDFSLRAGLKIFEIIRGAVTYTPRPDKSIYSNWGGSIGIMFSF